MEETTPMETFARTVRTRSVEHERAVNALVGARTPGMLVSLLRQELDSLVRVLYLSQQAAPDRARLLEQMERGEKWTRPTAKGKAEPVTDRMMVEAAATLHGWAASVYKFGCAFIHLSEFHDYATRDPLSLVTPAEREDVLRHMNTYHGSPVGPDVTFEVLIPYLPRVFEKVRSNLEHHLRDLERDQG